MNIAAAKTALANSNPNCIQTRVSLFHSTPVLARRRPNRHFDFRNQRYSKRYARESMLNSLNAYSDFIFESWREHHELDEDEFRTQDSTRNFGRGRTGSGKSRSWERSSGNRSYYFTSEDEDESPSGSPSWFRREFENNYRRARKNGSRNWAKRGFKFCNSNDEFDVGTIFRSAFHGKGFTFWSFVDDYHQRQSSSSEYFGRHFNWGHKYEKDYESDSDRSDDDSSESDLASERLTLGLSTYGPIKLEDVKAAYRSCALKWHPDRHQGSSKAVAEENFKRCSAAYQSLCDKLEADYGV